MFGKSVAEWQKCGKSVEQRQSCTQRGKMALQKCVAVAHCGSRNVKSVSKCPAKAKADGGALGKNISKVSNLTIFAVKPLDQGNEYWNMGTLSFCAFEKRVQTANF